MGKGNYVFRQLIFIAAAASLTPNIAFSQTTEDGKKIKVDARKPLRLDYKSPSWNKDNTKAETSALLVRDTGTGRLAKIVVTETGPDTSLFVGYYQLSFDTTAGTSAEMTPEIYVVKEALLSKKDALKSIDTMIREGQLLRKPFFFRTESKSVQAISVYDSKDQAFAAYEEFLKTGLGRPIVDRAALEAQRKAQLTVEQQTWEEAQAKAAAEQARLVEEEKKKAEALKAKNAAISAAEKEKNKKAAQAFADQAMEMFKLERYAEAEALFQKSIAMDPENQSYYFQYGVSLYKGQKYNKSLAVLELAQEGRFEPAERDYFIAMNHLKMKQNAAAYKAFVSVKNQNSKLMSPTAGFFAGVIDFQSGNYDSAKLLFEYVLDNSTDTVLDGQAESYIEQIANIRQFEELQKKKFLITANLGVMYDSNILAQDPAQTSLDLAGLRWSYGGSVEYRPVYTPNHEFSAILAVNDLYSVDKKLQASADLQNADPLVVGFGMPYVYKDILFEKPYRLSVAPSFEAVQMNLDRAGSRENIVNSGVFAVNQTLVVNPKWFSSLNLEYRSDQSQIDTVAPENQTAKKTSISLSQTLFADEKNSKAWSFDLGYANNVAVGENQFYNRVDLGVGYFMPLSANTTGNARFTYYNSRYPLHLTGRADTNYGVSLSTRTPLSEILSWNNALTYNRNDSTQNGSSYDRYVIVTTFSWAQNF